MNEDLYFFGTKNAWICCCIAMLGIQIMGTSIQIMQEHGFRYLGYIEWDLLVEVLL